MFTMQPKPVPPNTPKEFLEFLRAITMAVQQPKTLEPMVAAAEEVSRLYALSDEESKAYEAAKQTISDAEVATRKLKATIDGIAAGKKEIADAETANRERQVFLDGYQQKLNDRAAALDGEKERLGKKEKEIAARESDVGARERLNDKKEKAVGVREIAADKRDSNWQQAQKLVSGG